MAATAGTARKGSGKRQRYRGKMVGPSGAPRAHTHGGHSQAAAGWEMGAPAIESKHIPGRFKVSEPTKRWHRRGIVRNATTGEIIS